MPTLAALMLVAGSGSPLSAQPRPTGTTRTDLQRHDLTISGHEVFQARVDFAPGASFPRHTHPGEEIGYVLEGQVWLEQDGKIPVTLKAGQAFLIHPGTVHNATNTGPGTARVVATYLVEKGKPLATPAPAK